MTTIARMYNEEAITMRVAMEHTVMWLKNNGADEDLVERAGDVLALAPFERADGAIVVEEMFAEHYRQFVEAWGAREQLKEHLLVFRLNTQPFVTRWFRS
jgi:hypothetical protein